MNIERRQFFSLLGAAVAFTRLAHAESYPSRPVRLIIGYPPGGSADITARLIAQWLQERLGSHSWWRAAREPPLISPPRLSCTRLQTAIRCCWCPRRLR